MSIESEQWWPDHPNWPEYGPDSFMASEALALLLVGGDVVWYPGNGTPGIGVLCNDLFWWATADIEPIPWLDHGDDGPFWDLYARVRKDGSYGAEVWCCLRRGKRPQTPIERQWRESGRWTDELEALPWRDPKDCG